MKAHIINISNEIDPNIKQQVMKNLLTSESDRGYDALSRQMLLSQQVNMPDSVSLKNMGVLESRSECPIIVYYIHKRFYRGEVVYSLSCVRVPKRAALQKYTRPPCHLVMLTRSHVAYVPDIVAYLGLVFRDNLSSVMNRRCK